MLHSEEMSDKDTAFEMAVAAVRYGAGVTREVGMDLADRGIRRALIVTDPRGRRLPLRRPSSIRWTPTAKW